MVDRLEGGGGAAWNLEALIRVSAAGAEEARKTFNAHAGFFDEAIESLFACKAVHPNGSPTSSDPKEIAAFALHHATLGFVRTVARAGFLAFSSMVLECVATQRRAREALLAVDVLRQHPELSDSYVTQEQDKRATRDVLAALGKPRPKPPNPPLTFKSAFGVAKSATGDESYSMVGKSLLWRRLHQRCGFRLIHAGSHAGIMHSLLGKDEEANAINFFDRSTLNVPGYALLAVWDAIHLFDAAQTDFPWVDHAKWSQQYGALRKMAQELDRLNRKRYESPITSVEDIVPWSPFFEDPA